MTPIKNNATPGCVPASSNCVIWQGPAIPCISPCTGDSITTAIYNLAVKLCNSATGVVDLTSLQFKCLVDKYQTAPESLTQLLQLLINKVCSLDELLEELEEGGTPGTGTSTGTTGTVLVRLPECLQYEDDDHDEVLSLPHVDYSKLLATHICALLTDITGLKTRHDALVQRVETLEQELGAYGISHEVQVRLKCLLAAPDTIGLQLALSTMEEVLCDLKKSVGTNVQVVAALGKQCTGLAASPLLSDKTRTYGQLVGWATTPVTLADTVTNLWLLLCDVRTELIHVSNTLKATCADVLVDFNFTPDDATGRVGTLTLYGSTIIPANFRSASTSRIVISDGRPSHTLSLTLDADLLARSSVASKQILLTTTGLDVTDKLKFELIVDLIDQDNNVCSKSAIRYLRPRCQPTQVMASTILVKPAATSAVVSWAVPVATVAPLRYRVDVVPDSISGSVGGPVYTALTTSLSVLVPAGELTVDTGYVALVTAIYDCADAPTSSVDFRTLGVVATPTPPTVPPVSLVAGFENGGTSSYRLQVTSAQEGTYDLDPANPPQDLTAISYKLDGVPVSLPVQLTTANLLLITATTSQTVPGQLTLMRQP